VVHLGEKGLIATIPHALGQVLDENLDHGGQTGTPSAAARRFN